METAWVYVVGCQGCIATLMRLATSVGNWVQATLGGNGGRNARYAITIDYADPGVRVRAFDPHRHVLNAVNALMLDDVKRKALGFSFERSVAFGADDGGNFTDFIVLPTEVLTHGQPGHDGWRDVQGGTI